MKVLLIFVFALLARAEDRAYDVYTVNVHTGDVGSAGTNANIYLMIQGPDGHTGDHLLDSPSNDFERNQYDSFQFTDIPVGDIEMIRIRNDDSGYKPGWYLDYIYVEDNEGHEAFFPCDGWLADDEPGGLTRYLYPGQTCNSYDEGSDQ